MSKRETVLLLQDMIESIEKIERYIGNDTVDEFINDELKIDAVVRNLEIIGEAAARVTEEFKQEHQTIEWKKITGVGNRIIHAYFGVDLQIIWSIIKNDLPVLHQQLINIVNSYKSTT